MSLLKNLRETLGISQRQLAAFIGGDRTQLVRAENGERNLCDDASLQLLLLVPAYSYAKQQPVLMEAVESEWLPQLNLHAAACRHKASGFKKRLAQMQNEYEKAARLQIFVQQLQAIPGRQYSARQTRWLEQRLYEAEKGMRQCGPGQQRLLQLKIETLEAEAVIYEKQGGL